MEDDHSQKDYAALMSESSLRRVEKVNKVEKLLNMKASLSGRLTKLKEVRRGIVWWWKFLSRWCLRFKLGQCDANDGKIHHQSLSVPKRRWLGVC